MRARKVAESSVQVTDALRVTGPSFDARDWIREFAAGLPPRQTPESRRRPVRETNSPNLLVDFTVERPWRREAFVDANLLMWPPIGVSEHLAPTTTAWGHLA